MAPIGIRGVPGNVFAGMNGEILLIMKKTVRRILMVAIVTVIRII